MLHIHADVIDVATSRNLYRRLFNTNLTPFRHTDRIRIALEVPCNNIDLVDIQGISLNGLDVLSDNLNLFSGINNTTRNTLNFISNSLSSISLGL